MADPLAQTVDSFAPEQLHLFDTAQAGNILSRYADVSRSYDTRQQVERDRLSRDQGQLSLDSARRREERDRLLADRDDLEYQEKQAARQSRADLLGDLMDLDETDDAFDDNIIGLLKGAPPALQEDETIKDILRAKRDKAERIRQERERARLTGQREEYGMKKLEFQAKNRELMGYLKPEDYETLPRDPETGQVDMQAALSLAVQRKLEAKEGSQVRAFDRRANLARELAGTAASDRQMRVIFEDREAFGDPKEAALEQAKKQFPKYAKVLTSFEALKDIPDTAALYEDAKDAADNVAANEINRALRMSKEEYIEAGGDDMSKAARAARARVWDYADRGRGPTEPDKVDETAPETEESVVEESAAAEPDDGGFIPGKRYRDANGNEATYKGNGQWE